MADPYLTELRLVAFGVIPRGWALANGQLLPINQNQAIFALLGTTYGGNGQTNFGLPNLQGRAAMHQGTDQGQGSHNLGEVGGEYTHTLTIPEMAQHLHPPQAVNAVENSQVPASALLANTTGNLLVYGGFSSPVAMAQGSVSSVGQSQPHPNQSPFLVMSWIIALVGIFPSQN